MAAASEFKDILEANDEYVSGFRLAGIPSPAAKGLAVLTCMDSRIEPLVMLGLEPGDAKLLRNAGATVTDDVLRSLVLATNLLNVSSIALVGHTDCKMTKATDDELRSELAGRYPDADVSGWEFRTIADQRAALLADAEKLRACPLIPEGTTVGCFVYDVATGRLSEVTAP